MGAPINREQSLGIDRGVNLRGRQGGVAEQFLDRAQIAAARQEMSGERMAQRVRRRAVGQSECAPRRLAIANCTMRGDSGPPLAPTNNGPSPGSS